MNREDWLALAGEAFDLSVQQQRVYRAGRGDNGLRGPRDLYVNDIFWKYQGLIMWQLGKLVEGLITSTSPEEKAKRRVRFLSVLVTFLSRFVSLPGESNELISGKSIIPNRGIEHD